MTSRNAKAHFDPWKKSNKLIRLAPCGSNKAIDYDWVWNWDQVTCKRCLEKRDELQKRWEMTKLKNGYGAEVKGEN